MSNNTITERRIKLAITSDEALVNFIASNNDYDVENTQFLYEILEIAKLTINPLFDKNDPYNTIVRRDWDISNSDVIRARNFILNKLNLSLRM